MSGCAPRSRSSTSRSRRSTTSRPPKQKFISRMHIIEKLQRSRPEIVHLFDEIVKDMPDGTYLTGVKQTDQKFKLDGVAQSSTRVSTLHAQHRLLRSGCKNPELQVVRPPDGDRRHPASRCLPRGAQRSATRPRRPRPTAGPAHSGTAACAGELRHERASRNCRHWIRASPAAGRCRSASARSAICFVARGVRAGLLVRLAERDARSWTARARKSSSCATNSRPSTPRP